jgi:sigma-B regulation protein RsbU (phosphoserine phosphatase)
MPAPAWLPAAAGYQRRICRTTARVHAVMTFNGPQPPPGKLSAEQELQSLRTQLEEARRIIRHHLEQIAEIQRKLLPPVDYNIPGITLAASYTPFVSAGGDYYDVMPLAPVAGNTQQSQIWPRWGAIIADVSGHGPAAAVEAAMLDAILRTYPNLSDGPAAVLNYANRHFFSRQIRGNFITAFAANYDPQTGLLTYTNAGHNPPVLRRAGQPPQLELLDASAGIPLGVDRDHSWDIVEVPMGTGDLLVLYTDGVTETRNAAGEMFGTERLQQTIAACEPDPQLVITTLERALELHRQGTTPTDDETILVIRNDT